MSPLAFVRAGNGPIVVLVHGFTQASSSMAPLGDRLTSTHEVISVDLPGHGGSASISCDLDEAADLVIEVANGEPFDLVGYSLGGRVALHAACHGPDNLRSTVAISASIGIADPAARERRLERDRAVADQLDASGDVASFLDRWLANPLFATLPAGVSDRAGRGRNSAAGLAGSLRRCSVGAQRWLGDELKEIPAPLLLLAGARDDPYVAVAVDVAAATPPARCAIVPGAGHACHLEQPAITAALIEHSLRAGSA